MTRLAAVKIDRDYPRQKFLQLLDSISVEKKERILRFRQYPDALRGLIGELLLHFMLDRFDSVDSADRSVRMNEFGKPFFEFIKDVHFNISHSGDWVVCGISRQPIGVDVEEIGEIPADVTGRYFTSEEVEQIPAGRGAESEKRFYQIWTLKESYIKMEGQGLSIPLDSFSIQISEKNSIGVKIRGEESKSHYFRSYYPDQTHILSACSLQELKDVGLQFIGTNEIM